MAYNYTTAFTKAGIITFCISIPVVAAAHKFGHEQIVQRLLEKGADVNAQGGRYGNALQAASAEGTISL